MLNVEPYLSRNPLILELGCGGGKRDVRAVGVDLLDLPGVDIMGDALEVLSSLPESSVDSIYSEHFMEHVPQPPLNPQGGGAGSETGWRVSRYHSALFESVVL